jgi:four helix bundle protein
MSDSKKIESWKDLEVWRISHELVLKVYRFTRDFPPDERYRITDQLCRAAISGPTNIAEGKGRNSLREYLQFLSIARGSIEEVKYLLLLARDLNYLDKPKYEELIEGYDRVGKMINKLIISLRTHLPLKERPKSQPPNPQNPTPKTQKQNHE